MIGHQPMSTTLHPAREPETRQELGRRARAAGNVLTADATGGERIRIEGRVGDAAFIAARDEWLLSGERVKITFESVDKGPRGGGSWSFTCIRYR